MYKRQGINDTMVINPLVDVAGDNSVIRMIMDRGAAAIAGMTLHSSGKELESDKTKVGITMWGVTTPCVEHVDVYKRQIQMCKRPGRRRRI